MPVRASPRPLSLGNFLKPSQQDKSIDWTTNKTLLTHVREALWPIRFDKGQFGMAVRTEMVVIQSFHPATIEKAMELATIISTWWLENHAGDAMGFAAGTGMSNELAFPMFGSADQVASPSQFASVQETKEAVHGALAGIREDGSTIDGKPLIVTAR